jgi:hypothetical protein
MSKIIFSDFYDTEITVDFSRSGLVRLDLKNPSWPERMHMGEAIGHCISMTIGQAQILHAAIGQLLKEAEEE